MAKRGLASRDLKGTTSGKFLTVSPTSSEDGVGMRVEEVDVSQLPALPSAITDTDLFLITRSGVHYKATGATVKTFVGSTGGTTNTAPTVNAGADKAVIVGTSYTLTATGTDAEGAVTYAWTRVSGPNTPTMTNANTATVTVSGHVAGTYVFRATVTDAGGLTASDDVTVTAQDSSIIVMQDNFDDNSIDTANKWTVVNPNTGNVGIEETGGNLKIISKGVSQQSDIFANRVESKQTISAGAIAAHLDRSPMQTAPGYGMILGVDNANRIMISQNSSVAVEESGVDLYIVQAGVVVYQLKGAGAPIMPNRFKITKDAGHKIQFWFWNTTTLAWQEIDAATSKVYDIGASLKGMFICADLGTTGVVTNIVENFHMTSADYSTQYPA